MGPFQCAFRRSNSSAAEAFGAERITLRQNCSAPVFFRATANSQELGCRENKISAAIRPTPLPRYFRTKKNSSCDAFGLTIHRPYRTISSRTSDNWHLTELGHEAA